jgi:hypothetical protein
MVEPSDGPHATLLRLGHTAAAQAMLRGRAEHYRARLVVATADDVSPAAQAARAALSSCLMWLADPGIL